MSLLNGDQNISLAYDSIWLLSQSFSNPFLMKYIIFAAFTNFCRTFNCHEYTIIFDLFITRILFIQMIRFSSNIIQYILLFMTAVSYIFMKIWANKKNERIYHHNFHYWGYLTLSSMNNNNLLYITIQSIIYWIGVFMNKSQFSAFFPLINIIKQGSKFLY